MKLIKKLINFKNKLRLYKNKNKNKNIDNNNSNIFLINLLSL